MTKKSILLLSISLVLFPFIFQAFIREFWINAAVLTEIIILALFCIIFGRLYCGTLCQIGALQRMLNWVGLKLFKKRFEIPEKIDRYMRYLKYVFLASIIFISVYHMNILFNPYIPIDQFSYVFPDIELIALALIVVTIVGGVLFNNFFCKYLCIQGAINGLFGSLSRLKLKRNAETCIGCKKCTKKCPANLDVHSLDVVKSKECLYCQSCVIACPKKDVLEFYFFNKKITYPILLVLEVVIYIALGISAMFLLGS